MKQNLKFMAVFVISSVGIPLIAVYFGQVFVQLMKVMDYLTLG